MAAFDHNGVPGSALDRELRGLNCARCDRLSRDLAAAHTHIQALRDTLDAALTSHKIELAAALERAKSAGEDAFKLRVDLAAAQEELERVRDKCNEHYMALAAAQEEAKREKMAREYWEGSYKRDLAAAQEALKNHLHLDNHNAIVRQLEIRALAAEARAEQNAKDAERLQYLIDNAYSGLDEDLEEPMAVGMIVGGKVEWPDGVRRLIDAAIDAAREGK